MALHTAAVERAISRIARDIERLVDTDPALVERVRALLPGPPPATRSKTAKTGKAKGSTPLVVLVDEVTPAAEMVDPAEVEQDPVDPAAELVDEQDSVDPAEVEQDQVDPAAVEADTTS